MHNLLPTNYPSISLFRKLTQPTVTSETWFSDHFHIVAGTSQDYRRRKPLAKTKGWKRDFVDERGMGYKHPDSTFGKLKWRYMGDDERFIDYLMSTEDFSSVHVGHVILAQMHEPKTESTLLMDALGVAPNDPELLPLEQSLIRNLTTLVADRIRQRHKRRGVTQFEIEEQCKVLTGFKPARDTLSLYADAVSYTHLTLPTKA